MTERVKGIVIRATDYKETDKMLSILTDDRGVISVLARGVRRKSSKITPCAQLFTYCTFQFYRSGDRYILDDGDIEAQFMGLTLDIEKMALACYLAQLAAWEQGNTHVSEGTLRLLLNSVYAVDKELVPRGLIKAAFELKCAQLWGFEPAMTLVGESKSGILSIRVTDGRLTYDGTGRPVSRDAIEAVKYVLKADLKKLFSFGLQGQGLDDFCGFCQSYILDKIEFTPKTLLFYEELCRTPS